MHRDVTPLTGSLALVAGGASGLVAIARELGGDDRVVSVVQYLRVALVTASMPVLVTLVYHADRSHPGAAVTQTDTAPWYLSIGMLIALVVVGATVGRWIRLPGAGLLGPLALTVLLEVTGLSFGLSVPMVLVQVGYALIGWQAGLAFTRESLRAVGRMLPTAVALIVVLTVATAGLGVVLAHVAGLTPLEGYLATSPGGVYAVLATAVETGSNVTFIIAAQVVRILLMLFAAPLLARGMVWLNRRLGPSEPRDDPRQQGTHQRRGLTARLQHLVVAQRLARHTRCEIGHQRHPKHLGTRGARRDGLVHGRHADEIRAQRAQHPDLGGRLVLRPVQSGVDAVGECRIDFAGNVAQARGVRVDHVDEMGTDQR